MAAVESHLVRFKGILPENAECLICFKPLKEIFPKWGLQDPNSLIVKHKGDFANHGLFHLRCIKKWSRNSPAGPFFTCPSCRVNVTKDSFDREFFSLSEIIRDLVLVVLHSVRLQKLSLAMIPIVWILGGNETGIGATAGVLFTTVIRNLKFDRKEAALTICGEILGGAAILSYSQAPIEIGAHLLLGSTVGTVIDIAAKKFNKFIERYVPTPSFRF
jgi:hypothetical protein